MDEYIKRDNSLLIYISEGAYEQIQRVPAADVVEVRHGRWIDLEQVGFATWETECSCCGVKAYKQFRFCPNCGALMDKDGDA